MCKEKTYREDIMQHKELVGRNIKTIIDELYERQLLHDNDKIANDVIFEAYDKHSKTLRELEFGTPEYKNYLNENFGAAMNVHSQNRHHFNSLQYEQNYDLDMIDILEAICDVKAAISRNSNLGNNEIVEQLHKATVNMLNVPTLEILIQNTINNLFRKDEK